MKRNRWTARLACGLLVVTTLVVAAVAAGNQGSQTDPLVTLSYLNEKVLPDILKQVDKKVEEGTKDLREEFKENSDSERRGPADPSIRQRLLCRRPHRPDYRGGGMGGAVPQPPLHSLRE